MMRVMMPLIVGAMFWGDRVILLVLGEKWADTIPIFEILAIGMLIRPLSNAAGWLLLARGHTGRLLMFRVSTFWVTPALYVAGAWWNGVLGVAIASAISSWVMALPWLWFAERGTGIGLWNMIRPTLVPMIAAFAAASIARFAIPYGNLIAVGGVLMIPIYVALLCAWARSFKPVHDFHDSFLAILGKKARA